MADRDSALHYHRYPKPGKIGIHATKPVANQRDLALAYSPGVASACEEIVRDPREVANMTSRANLVGVVTNGTAVLGLGNIGPLAAKPVMEGKAVLFKKFAGIDVFDIEVNATNPQQLIDTVASLEPTFGAIQLEDIKAPECFIVEKALRERMNIPVFHDDQHGTAICVAAAVINGLRYLEKDIAQVRLVCSGAGAAALACLDLLVDLGLTQDNITITDIVGVVYKGRTEEMDEYKARFAIETEARTLDDVIEGADIFLGLSAPNVLKQEMVAKMVERPLIFALANPIPEIMPEKAREVRPDAIIATGRSDYPNQVNNVLCFPFLFRGALDVGATQINREMEIACVHAIADLVEDSSTDFNTMDANETIAAAYGGSHEIAFGPNYIIPKPFDPRLITEVPPKVAKAAMDSGVATRPIEDLEAYEAELSRYVSRSGSIMRSLFSRAKEDPKRLIYTNGEDNRVLRSIQVLIDENAIKTPIVIGRRSVIVEQIRRLRLHIKPDVHFELLEPSKYPNIKELADEYHEIMGRRGVSPETADLFVRTKPSVLGALLLRRGEADALIAGPVGTFREHLEAAIDVIGMRPDVPTPAAMQMLILDRGTYFISDTSVTYDPDAEQLADITQMATSGMRTLGIEPKVALVSHSNFGSADTPSAQKMRDALEIITAENPDLEIDGEMQMDAALSESIRRRLFPNSPLSGEGNLFIMPNLDSASIAFNGLKALGNGVSVGPLLLGMKQAVHIISRTMTTRGLVNLSIVATVDAQTIAPKVEPAPEVNDVESCEVENAPEE